MEFRNDISKLNKEMFDNMKNTASDLIISSLAIISAIYFRLEELEVKNIGLVMMLEFLVISVILIVFFFQLYKNYKKRYINFILDVQGNDIIDKYSNVNIKLDNDCKILKYKNGKITIKNGKKNIFVSKYINNKIEFENALSVATLKNVKNETLFSRIIGSFVFVFFVHLIFINTTKGFELYLFLGIGFIFLGIISTICSIIYKEKNILCIIGIILKILLIFIVIINMLEIIIG